MLRHSWPEQGKPAKTMLNLTEPHYTVIAALTGLFRWCCAMNLKQLPSVKATGRYQTQWVLHRKRCSWSAMWTGHIFTIVLLTATAIATSLSPLVPSKRAVGLQQRSQWRRDIIPRDTVILNYGVSPYHPTSAAVTLFSLDERPILLLEDFEHLLKGVRCRSGHYDELEHAIVLDFMDDSAFDLAAREWTFLQDFSVVTAHSGCNSAGERGAWRVSAVIPERSMLRVTLVVERVQMRDIVKSFAVTYTHGGATSWTPPDSSGPTRRDENGFDSVFNFGYNPSFDVRMPLFPPNSSLDDSVAVTVVSELTDAEIALTCVDCTFTTNVTIGLDFEIDVTNGSCITSSEQCFTFNSAAMNLTVEQFEQDAALEVFLGKELQAGANYKILEVPVAPALIVPSLIDLAPAVGLEIAFELDISSSINFTFGAKAHIPDGAFASLSLVNATRDWDPTVVATGWDGSSVDQVPFRVNAGEFNISTSMAFAPFAEISFTILDVGASLRLVQNMPKVGMDASIQTSVNRQCNPISADDYESFGTAFIVGSGITLSTEAELEFEEGKFIGHGIPNNWDFTLWAHDVPFTPALGINTTACFVLSDGNVTVNLAEGASKVVALADVPASTGTLLSAQSAVPTWDFNKIESYYSANGQLPTNVNYGQMVQATTVPANLQAAVDKAASANSALGSRVQGSGGLASACVLALFIVLN